MSKLNNNFSYDDGVNLKDLLEERTSNIKAIIDINDKNYCHRFENLSEMTHMALTNADKATTKAEAAIEKRFDSVNEFRLTLSDQTQTFLTRAEFDAKWESMEKNRKDNTAFIIAMTGLVVSIISLIIKFVI